MIKIKKWRDNVRTAKSKKETKTPVKEENWRKKGKIDISSNEKQEEEKHKKSTGEEILL